MATPTRPHIPTIEWVVGFSSLAIVLGTIGYLVFAVAQGEDEAPRLTVVVDSIREYDRSYMLDVIVRNESRIAAADVHLVGAVRSEDGEHRAQARLDYVPGLSTRRASLVFPVHPDDADIRIVGFVIP